MILSRDKDPRLVTVRRGGTLSDDDHHRLALWAALCAEHVLAHFEGSQGSDERPSVAIEKTRAWAQGEIRTTESKVAAYHANEAARNAPKPAKFAAYAAGQAAVVAHVPEHALGAAAYALRSVAEAGDRATLIDRVRAERDWQWSQLPIEIRDLVLEDAHRRDALCWGMFSL